MADDNEQRAPTTRERFDQAPNFRTAPEVQPEKSHSRENAPEELRSAAVAYQVEMAERARDPDSEATMLAKEARKSAEFREMQADRAELGQRMPLRSLPGHSIAYNNADGRSGVVVETPDRSVIEFGGREAIEAFAKERNLSAEDLDAMRRLDAQADAHRSQSQYEVSDIHTGTVLETNNPLKAAEAFNEASSFRIVVDKTRDEVVASSEADGTPTLDARFTSEVRDAAEEEAWARHERETQAKKLRDLDRDGVADQLKGSYADPNLHAEKGTQTVAAPARTESLQEILDRREAIASRVEEHAEAIAVAVDRSRDPRSDGAAVQQEYEAAAREYAAAKQAQREFEAEPAKNPEAVAKYRELQQIEERQRQADVAVALARADRDEKAMQAAQERSDTAKADLAAFAKRENVKMGPDLPETDRNTIERGMTPEQLAKLVKRDAQATESEADKAQEAKKAAALQGQGQANVGEGHNQVRDQSAVADAQAKDKLVPPEVAANYKRDGQKYLDANDPKKVAFVDKGNRLQTIRTFDDKAVEDMVATADARGWSELKVSGDEAFRRKAWLEATARGIEVKGYEPTEQDKARAEQLAKQTGHANAIEKNETLEAYRAAKSANPQERRDAARQHPELVKAFALEAAARSFARQRLDKKDQEAFVQRTQEIIERDLAQGKPIPEIRRREEVQRDKDHGASR